MIYSMYVPVRMYTSRHLKPATKKKMTVLFVAKKQNKSKKDMRVSLIAVLLATIIIKVFLTTSLVMAMSIPMKSDNDLFPNCLPLSRLGTPHPTLESFEHAVKQSVTKTKEFTLIVVTSDSLEGNGFGANVSTSSDNNNNTPQGRILLGMKNRGFGKGYYNSFGGKFDSPEETVEECACRELWEETNIRMELGQKYIICPRPGSHRFLSRAAARLNFEKHLA